MGKLHALPQNEAPHTLSVHSKEISPQPLLRTRTEQQTRVRHRQRRKEKHTGKSKRSTHRSRCKACSRNGWRSAIYVSTDTHDTLMTRAAFRPQALPLGVSAVEACIRCSGRRGLAASSQESTRRHEECRGRKNSLIAKEDV